MLRLVGRPSVNTLPLTPSSVVTPWAWLPREW